MSAGIRLSSVDGSFLYLETPETPMHVGSMAIFKLPDTYWGDFFEGLQQIVSAPASRADAEVETGARRSTSTIRAGSTTTSSSTSTAISSARRCLRRTTARRSSASSAGCTPSCSTARPLWNFTFRRLPNNEVGLIPRCIIR